MGISIVIPLFNKERHIKETIESILRQTYNNFEICVIDDGSTDNSANIVERICDDRIKLIRKKNEGVSKTRNLGATIAKNKFIAFLDADDQWKENYLEEMVSLINKYPNAELYGSNYEVVERGGRRFTFSYPNIGKSFSSGLIKNFFESAYVYTPLWTSAVIIKKSTFIALGGFPTDITNGEDLHLWCRCALEYRIAYINKPLAIYRRDSDNMLSRSISTPSYFPFLDNYIFLDSHLIKDQNSVWKYIVRRQLEAASASLFIVKNPSLCRKILKSIKKPNLNKKKFYGLYVLSYFPSVIIFSAQRIRQKKRFKNLKKSL